jgi:hypothetical protein
MGTKISVVENFLGLLLLYTMIDNCKNQLKIDDLGGLMMTAVLPRVVLHQRGGADSRSDFCYLLTPPDCQ